MTTPRILYCHCAHAQVVPREVKTAILQKLCESQASFEAVGDLCEMSARRDPALRQLADAPSVKIVACYPRAVKWLFSAAGAPLPKAGTEVINMRAQTAEEACGRLFAPEIMANLPEGKGTAAS